MTLPDVSRQCRQFLVILLAVLLPALSVAAQRDPPASLRVAVFSDLNSSYGTVGYHDYIRRAVASLVEHDPDLVIITGDMVAGQIKHADDDKLFQEMWAAFHHEVSEPLESSGIPLAVTPGNHDASALPAFALERQRFALEWQHRMTGLQYVDHDGFPFRYAFELYDTLFVALDVTTTAALDDEQFDWLESLLRRSRTQYRDVVVFSHLPVWPVAVGRLNEATHDKRLHRLLVTHRVGVYLSGHHHAFFPGVADGIAYISQACLGSGPRRLLGSDAPPEPRGYTLLEFELQVPGGGLRVASLKAPYFDEAVHWDTLPSVIDVADIRLQRADLADVAVAPLSLRRGDQQ